MAKIWPTRLDVILAREAPVGMVLRSGEPGRVCALAWNRDDDTFQLGQWLKGDVDARRADLSTDGRYAIFWARGRGVSWTAVSIVPYLSALVFDPAAYPGGGLFLDEVTYLLNRRDVHRRRTKAGPKSKVQRPRPLLRRGEVRFGGNLVVDADAPLALYHQRLVRDGWALDTVDIERHGDWPEQQVGELTRPLTHGWVLRRVTCWASAPEVPYFATHDEYSLRHPERQVTIDLPAWDWADWDRDRLLWAADGQLWSGRLGADGLAGEYLLHDFRDMKFEEIRAPYPHQHWRRMYGYGG